MNKLYMHKIYNIMYELIGFSHNAIFVTNNNVDGKITVRKCCDPLTVFEREYEYIGEIE
jgi:hypothetical protein